MLYTPNASHYILYNECANLLGQTSSTPPSRTPARRNPASYAQNPEGEREGGRERGEEREGEKKRGREREGERVRRVAIVGGHFRCFTHCILYTECIALNAPRAT